MKFDLLTISQTAELIGISIQTLRRWDKAGKLKSIRKTKTGNRYYERRKIEEFVRNNPKNLFSLAKNWASTKRKGEPLSVFYCKDASIFQARLTRLERDLAKIKNLREIYPLITAITGEIGNNSFDHNLGNWPDIPGVFFTYNLNKRKIILADRGQGILKTLKKAKPSLLTDQGALKVAFTEIISGRAPEYRGNGLKFVKDVVIKNKLDLSFQTGTAKLRIKKEEKKLKIKKSKIYLQGCLALIEF